MRNNSLFFSEKTMDIKIIIGTKSENYQFPSYKGELQRLKPTLGATAQDSDPSSFYLLFFF